MVDILLFQNDYVVFIAVYLNNLSFFVCGCGDNFLYFLFLFDELKFVSEFECFNLAGAGDFYRSL
jgi:hypothetical protein